MPRGLYPRLPPVERFWNKVDPCRTDGCALWVGYVNRKGYGYFVFEGHLLRAHHFLIGKPPKGFEWDHLCRIRNCVWPDHLELVTHQVNVQRGDLGKTSAARNRAKTHCPHGHEYTLENTRIYRGGRYCRTCRSLRP